MNTAVELTPEFIESADAFDTNPYLYLEGVLGVTSFEEYQRRVIDTVWANDRTCVSACHDVGKTFLAARLAMAVLNIFPGSKVITTAPTYNQVERILWAELRAAHSRSKIPLGGKLNTTDWTFAPDWFAIGFSPRNETTGGEGQGTASSFQGFHPREGGYLFIIFDEATGIPHNLWTMAEGLMTSGRVKFLAIGNPTSSASGFYDCFKSREWAKVYLSCFDSPNLQANGINNIEDLKRHIAIYKAKGDVAAREWLNQYKVVKSYLLTAKWVVAQAAKWGIDHPLTVSKILGRFPKAGAKTLIPLGFVEDAQRRLYLPKPTDRKIIGVDVARSGTNASVLTGLHGKKQTHLKETFQEKATQLQGEIIAMSRDMGGADIVVIDATGMGGPVVDHLEEEIGKTLPKGCVIRGVQFGAGVECDGPSNCEHITCAKAKWFNMKARMFGLLEEDVKAIDGLALLDESGYLDELPTIRKDFNKKGQMVIESKDEYTKRTGRDSPDKSDSLALANLGRYDELKFGTFTKTLNPTTKTRPHAGGLNSKRNW